MAPLSRSAILLFGAGASLSQALLLEKQASGKSSVDAVKEIQQRLEKEADADKDATEKLGCWCQKYVDDKQQMVENSRAELDNLGHDIDAKTASSQQLDVEMGQHQSDLEDNQRALDTAKALREKEAQKFADDEQSHVQAVDALSGAMTALKSDHAHDAEIKMEALFAQNAAFLQMKGKGMMARLRGAVGAKQTPDMVYGTLKQMQSTFTKQLDDMRHDESRAVQSHDELYAAKNAEINSLKKQLLDKKVRASSLKVEISQQSEQKDRSRTLLEANVAALAEMKDLCSASADAAEERQGARQAEVQRLADALTDLVGAELLAVHTAQKQAPDVKSVVGDLCLAAAGISNRDWNQRAKQACKKAQGGSLQEAADDLESLKDDIGVTLSNTTSEKQQCQQEGEDAKREAASAAEATEAEANEVASDKAADENSLKSIDEQVTSAQQAQEDLASATSALSQVMQQIHAGAVHDENVLEKVKATAPTAAAAKLEDAVKSADKLVEAAGAFDKAHAEKVQTSNELLQAVVRAGKKAEIPLKLMRADAEEHEVKITEDQHADARLARASCDLPSLALKEQKLQGYIKQLGDASEGLTWQFLR